MQPQSNGYKYATWILVIIVVVLLFMLSMKSKETVTDTFTDINQELSDCRMRLIAWNEEYPQGTTTDPDGREELQAIIDDCSEVVVDAQEEL